MADTAVEITAGTGTNIDTRTEATNGNHRQVIVIGDGATNAGIAPVDVTNGLAVQIIPALPAGTNAIGKLAANTGVIIGDVNVVSAIPGTGATNLGKAEDVAHTTGDTGIAAWGVANEAQTTLANDGDYIGHATDTKGNKLVVGNVASGTTDAGNPVKVGGQARTTNPTAVTDGQRVNAIFDKLGKQICVGAIRVLKGKQATTITASTAETTIVTAVASTFLDLYGLIISNTSATACDVTIRDDTAGTILCDIEVPPTDMRGFMLAVDSAIPQAVVNKPWTAQCSASLTSIKITALFVQNT